ncbi:YodL domain-containing protein [Clostridium sp. C105KSO13]|uniref:YodL domain-containing protein n=1 Tax=Clostridium sp. C105KSO13 TaxID=1776045 RepID=UPI000740630A|nr:YodL domain-containing protein [Clostridium sp. C105KSO13]CUX33183.1 hypothetical protein BN3456_01470 [Clostridium sp. C105KSO13]
MDINQFAVYQMKNIPQTRQMRFRAYETLQKSGVQVRYEHYELVYISRMQREDTPGSIRLRLKQKLPKNFRGHSISVSDVLVLNHEGEVTAYYVEKEGFKVITGFIRNGSSGALLNFETTNFHIEGKAGSWLVLDTIIIEGREFFLMEHESYGADAAYVVLDADGKVVADDNRNGFDDYTKQQLKDYVHPQEPIPVPPIPAQKPSLENWQKYMENGEYLRSAEMSEEQNYNMIDGRNNNTAPKKERSSVLAKLHQKQREIAKRSNQPIPDRSVAEDMERRKE